MKVYQSQHTYLPQCSRLQNMLRVLPTPVPCSSTPCSQALMVNVTIHTNVTPIGKCKTALKFHSSCSHFGIGCNRFTHTPTSSSVVSPNFPQTPEPWPNTCYRKSEELGGRQINFHTIVWGHNQPFGEMGCFNLSVAKGTVCSSKFILKYRNKLQEVISMTLNECKCTTRQHFPWSFRVNDDCHCGWLKY